MTLLRGGVAPDFRFHGIVFVDNPLRVAMKHKTGMRQGNLLFGADKQMHAQFLFNAFDVIGHGWLREVEVFGSARKAFCPGYFQKCIQLFYIHKTTPL